MTNDQLSIGVDVGGSHISCKVYNLSEKKLLHNGLLSMEINNQGSADEILIVFEELLHACLSKIDQAQLAGIGIAMPGPFDYKNGIALFSGENAKFVQLKSVNLRTELAKRLVIEEKKIRFINDATAFAIGEYFNGFLKGTDKSLAITLGTGFGSAFLSKGKPVIESASVPKGGVLWNEPFETGIADDYFSTRGLIARFNALSGAKVQGVKEIADIHASNEYAKHVLDDFGTQLANLLSPWLKGFEAEKMVIGGNISKAFYLFEKSFKKQLSKLGVYTETSPSCLLEDAAFIGSAALLDEDYYKAIEQELEQM
jgi:glucokinase